MQCDKCDCIAQPNDRRQWSTTCGCAQSDLSRLRRALTPVEDWFDLDGEAGPALDLIDIVAEVAQTLVQDRAELVDAQERLRRATQLLQLRKANLEDGRRLQIRLGQDSDAELRLVGHVLSELARQVATQPPPPGIYALVGLTVEERAALTHLVAFWNAFVVLNSTYDAVDEVRHAVHLIQNVMAARVARRVNPEFWV